MIQGHMLDQVFEALQEPVIIFDLTGRPTRINGAAYEIVGIPRRDFTPAQYLDLLFGAHVRFADGSPASSDDFPSRRVLRGESHARDTFVITGKSGLDVFLEATATPVSLDGKLAGVVLVLRDVTTARRAEARLQRLICTLRAHSHTDAAALRASNETRYLSEVCRIIVEDCGYPMAWVGLAEQDAAHTVRPVAHAGFDEGYLEQISVTWGDGDRGRGPTGTAIRTGEPSYCSNMLTDTRLAPWREQAIKRGYASSIALPLSIGDAVFGALTVYFRQPDALSADETALLAELAHDIADGVRVLRLRTAEAEARETLVRQAEALERADRIKDEFLATLSHELRTPLSTILVWAHLLLHADLDKEARRRAEEAILRNAEMQRELINDLLDVSRIISGKVCLSVSDVVVGDVLAAALDVVRPAADAKRLLLQVNVRTDAVVSADPGRLQQVFWNLLSNAVKFTPEGGTVTVDLNEHDGHVRVCVSDNGVGVSSDFLPHIFERFAQEDSSASRQFGGLGLGLAIVRHLVELHGGVVTAESAGEGRGSSFTVTLPRRSPGGSANEQGATDQGEQQEVQAAAALGTGALDGMRILAVDDDADARDLFATVLTALGAEVIVAASSEQALDQLQVEKFDILLADIGMPGTDGYALIEAVRLLPGAAGRIPAIAVTAFGRQEDRARALEAGYQAHLSKPVLPDQLAAAITWFCRGREG